MKSCEAGALALLEESEDALIILQEGTLVYVNRNGVKAVGYAAEDLVGQHFSRFVHPDDLWMVDQRYRHRFLTRNPSNLYPFRLVSKNGDVLWFDTHAASITWKGAPAILSVFHRVEAGEKLQKLKCGMTEENRLGGIIGKSPAMQKVFDLILLAADSDAPVLVYGESGTGKELVSRAVHDFSARSQGPFIPVNCGAIPNTLMESELFGYKKGAFTGANQDKAGLLDMAKGGTVFFDELADIDKNMQVKLLRAIEGGGYIPVGGDRVVYPDIRIICATNRKPGELVQEGSLREDFFYRINVVPVTIPPLRERREDIELLIRHFAVNLGEKPEKGQAIASIVSERYSNHPWPGNARELENVVRRYITLGNLWPVYHPAEGATTIEAIKPRDGETLKEAMERFEKEVIVRTLEAHRWHRGQTAEVLGVDRKTLFRKMQHYGV